MKLFPLRQIFHLFSSLFLLLALLFLLPLSLSAQEERIRIEALYLDFFPKEGRLLGISQVVFVIDDYTIKADWMEILFFEGLLRARGQVLIEGPETIGGEELELSLEEMRGTIRGGELLDRDFRLEALEMDFSVDKLLLRESYYSPCPPGYEEIYFTAKRIELTEDYQLLAYHVDFYFFQERFFSLPRYSGWIRHGRFYPSTPIPTPGYTTKQGFYVKFYYNHYVDALTEGEYTFVLSQVDPALDVDYEREGSFYGGLRLREKREGLLLALSLFESLDLSFVMQKGENFFLSKEEKEVILYWPSLALHVKPLPIIGPLSLSFGLGYAQLAEGEGELISCGEGSFLLNIEPISLGNLSYRGDLMGRYRIYGTRDELVEYSLEQRALWKIHPLLQALFTNRWIGYQGEAPFLFHDPLPGASLEGLRSYYDLALSGREGGFYWDLGGGLVKYPTGEEYMRHFFNIGSTWRILPGLHLEGSYSYQDVSGDPLLAEDMRRKKNHIMPALLLALAPISSTNLDLAMRGEYGLDGKAFEKVTLGAGASFRSSADRFQFHLGASYDIVQERWVGEGLKLEFQVRTSTDLPLYQLAMESRFKEEVEALSLSLRRESPCFSVELKAELLEPSLEIVFGTNF